MRKKYSKEELIALIEETVSDLQKLTAGDDSCDDLPLEQGKSIESSSLMHLQLYLNWLTGQQLVPEERAIYSPQEIREYFACSSKFKVSPLGLEASSLLQEMILYNGNAHETWKRCGLRLRSFLDEGICAVVTARPYGGITPGRLRQLLLPMLIHLEIRWFLLRDGTVPAYLLFQVFDPATLGLVMMHDVEFEKTPLGTRVHDITILVRKRLCEAEILND